MRIVLTRTVILIPILSALLSDLLFSVTESKSEYIADSIEFGTANSIVLDGSGLSPSEDIEVTARKSNPGVSQGERSLSACSPGQKIRLEFSLNDQSGGNACPVYRVWYRDTQILGTSSIGLSLKGNAYSAQGFSIADAKVTNHDSNWKTVCGERSFIRDRYQQLTVLLRQPQGNAPSLRLTFRCYDEGIAFRYELVGNRNKSYEITKELTEFAFLGDHVTWSTRIPQGVHVRKSLSSMKQSVERPLVLKTSSDLYVAIAEAALDNYAAMRLATEAKKPNTLVCHLAGSIKAKLPFKSPWRVVMMAESPGALLENNDIIRNLNEPCVLSDTSWIRPGKVLREVTLTTHGATASIDYAVDHNIQYILFDAGWYGHEYDETADATTVSVDPARSRGPLDMHRVIQYAEKRGIGVILYVNRRSLERQLDELLPLYKSWGVKGIKFGFVNTGTQDWTNWLHKAVRKAAEHRLMINVHDRYRPTGFERTYPNLMTVEGIGGDETAPSNEAVISNVLVRSLAGPADSTMCYFDKWVEKQSSHGCQLAKAVCFYSPWQFLYWYDRPNAEQESQYADNVIVETPELDFWDELPTVWDDTRVLHGSIGEYVTIARRAKDKWFIGAINSDEARELVAQLDFLRPDEKYLAIRYRDDPAVQTKTRVGITLEDVNSKSELSLSLMPRKGEAIRIVPAESEDAKNARSLYEKTRGF